MHDMHVPIPSKTATLGYVNVCILLVQTLNAQSQTPSFEVASVKLANGASSVAITPHRSGDRITYVTSLAMLVYYSYEVQPFQIRGEGLDDVYEVQAVTSVSADDREVRQMFQTLLLKLFALDFIARRSRCPATKLSWTRRDRS
jgi:uncharacterized protein (TIGR03435 family)